MKSARLNPAQLCLLETFSSIRSQEEAEELTRVIRNYYAQKLDNELATLWDNGVLNQEKLDDLRGQHLRAHTQK